MAGGDLITVRYSLGRLLGCNLFRHSDAEVSEELRSYVKKRISRTAGALVDDDGLQAWKLFDPILRFDFLTIVEGSKHKKPRDVAAVEAFLRDPSITLADLAREVGTTEKQLNRMSHLGFARALYTRLCNHGATSTLKPDQKRQRKAT